MDDQAEGWPALVRASWAAVPANDLLVGRREAVAFAASARLLKHRRSSSLLVPMAGSDTLLALALYLRRLQREALAGLIRAPWLNPGTARARPDLVIWTRAQARYRQCCTVDALQPVVLASHLEALCRDEGIGTAGRTVLLSGEGDLLQAFDLLEKVSRPFVFVIDATPTGLRTSAPLLARSLMEYFPETPRVVLAACGDDDTAEALADCEGGGDLWRMRLNDVASTEAGRHHPETITLGVVADATLDGLLANAERKRFELEALVKKEPAAERQGLLAPLVKVLRALRSLNVPLALLEERLEIETRPGRYPIRTLARWLERAGLAEFRYGDTQTAHQVLREDLEEACLCLRDAVSGRAEALATRAAEAARGSLTLAILVGTEVEAKALRTWLERSCEVLATVRVMAMDGVCAPSAPREPFDEVIVAATLWPSRRHWLALPCAKLTVLCHPFEQAVLERQLVRWWSRHGCASDPMGDKRQLWQLEWPRAGRCLDEATRPCSEAPVRVAVLDYNGRYPRPPRIVEFPLPERCADWIETLMAEPSSEANSSEAPIGAQDAALVWVTVAGHPEPIAWSPQRSMLVLRDDKLVPTPPEMLAAGDEIVLLVDSEERVATLAALLELFHAESHGLQELSLVAEQWQELVAGAHRRLGDVHALHARLQREGVNVSEAAVRTWVNHAVIGPENRKAIEVCAAVMEVRNPKAKADLIDKAVRAIRDEHRSIGRDLRKALLRARAGRADELRIGKLRLDGRRLASLVEVCEVAEVRHPAPHDTGSRASLSRIAEDIEREHPGRIVFTEAARRSMKGSPYRDLRRFHACLELVATRLYEVYGPKSLRLNEAVEHFRQIQVEFAGAISETTQGRFAAYDRQYKGQRVNIGRHLKLGSRRDPSTTLRIHFHWDDEDQRIVIHHAGEHLPTSFS